MSFVIRCLRFGLNPPLRLVAVLGLLAVVRSAAGNYRAWQADKRNADDYLERGRRPVVLNSQPLISILTAVWNTDDDLDSLVRSFESIDYANKELIVAVGGAHWIDPARKLPKAMILTPHPGGRKLAALRKCLSLAKGEVVYLTDGDCRINPEGFQRLIAPIVNGEAEATSGRHMPLRDQLDNQFAVAQWAAQTFADTFASERDRGLVGSNAAIRRSVLEQTGGFDYDAEIASDAVLGLRLKAAGFPVRSVPHAWVETRYHETVGAYLRQMSRWRRGNIRLRTANNTSISGVAFHTFRDAAFVVAGVLAPFAGNGFRLGFLILLLRRMGLRLRQVAFLSRIGVLQPRPLLLLYLVRQVYLDCLVGLIAVFQLLVRRYRDTW